jgi:MFS family permease
MVSCYLAHFSQFPKNVKLFLIGNAIQGLGLSIYGLLFNLYLKELGFGESAIGGLISTTSLGISLMAIPAALIIEKFHVKHLVVAGLFLSSLFYFMQIHNIDEGSLFAYGLLASMFLALFNISVSPFYLRNSTPEVRVHLFTLNSSMIMVAHLIGYLFGGFLPQVIHHLMPALSQVEIFRRTSCF